jgi:hypothetical protein
MVFNYVLSNYVLSSIILVVMIIIQILFTYIKGGSQFTNSERINCPDIISSCWGYGVSQSAYNSARIRDNSCKRYQYYRYSPIHAPMFAFMVIGLIIIFYIKIGDRSVLEFLESIVNEGTTEDERSSSILALITTICFIISVIVGGDISIILLVPQIFCVASILYQIIL